MAKMIEFFKNRKFSIQIGYVSLQDIGGSDSSDDWIITPTILFSTGKASSPDGSSISGCAFLLAWLQGAICFSYSKKSDGK